MPRKAVTYFKTIGKWKVHQMGSRTRYVPIAGDSGPEFRQVSEPRFKITGAPTPVYDEATADRLRTEKYFGRSFVECTSDGTPLGSAPAPAKADPRPEPQDARPTTAEANPVPVDALEVTDTNGAIAFLAGNVDGFNPDLVRDNAGRLNAMKVKAYAGEQGIRFPNW